MKTFLSLLVLAAVMLTPILVRAEEQHPESTRSAAAALDKGANPARPLRLLLAPGGARMSVGAAELKLDVAPSRWGITMSLAL